MFFSRRAGLALLAVMAFGLAACGTREATNSVEYQAGSPQLRALIDQTAKEYDIPPSLLHRVVKRESNYNPAARHGPYYGLMQINPQTAKIMGYRGTPEGLLDARTNLKYAGKYLRGAWLVSNGSQDKAIGWYARGYYYEAKRRGLLKETGLRS